MRPLRRAGAVLAVGAITAGCSSAPPIRVPASPADTAAAAAPTPFDGTYNGTLTMVRSSGRRGCGHEGAVMLTINGGAYDFEGGRRLNFNGSLASDGSFTATAGNTTLQGQAAAGHATGTLEGERCGYTFDLKKAA